MVCVDICCLCFKLKNTPVKLARVNVAVQLCFKTEILLIHLEKLLFSAGLVCG